MVWRRLVSEHLKTSTFVGSVGLLEESVNIDPKSHRCDYRTPSRQKPTGSLNVWHLAFSLRKGLAHPNDAAFRIAGGACWARTRTRSRSSWCAPAFHTLRVEAARLLGSRRRRAAPSCAAAHAGLGQVCARQQQNKCHRQRGPCGGGRGTTVRPLGAVAHADHSRATACLSGPTASRATHTRAARANC